MTMQKIIVLICTGLILLAATPFQAYTQKDGEVRKVVGIQCSEKKIKDMTGWLPNPPSMDATSKVSLTRTLQNEKVDEVKLSGSVEAGLQASVLNFVRMDATVKGEAAKSKSIKTSFTVSSTLDIEVPKRKQVKVELWGLYHTFSAEYYSKSKKKWIPFTFDRLVKYGTVQKWKNV